MSILRSPLGRARGLGSSRSGSDHYWSQRITAVVLVPLSLWLVSSLITLSSGDVDSLRLWLAHPAHAAALLLTLYAGFWHGQLGMQVVIEDYIHTELTKHLVLIFTRGVAAFLAISATVSTLKLALGG